MRLTRHINYATISSVNEPTQRGNLDNLKISRCEKGTAVAVLRSLPPHIFPDAVAALSRYGWRFGARRTATLLGLASSLRGWLTVSTHRTVG